MTGHASPPPQTSRLGLLGLVVFVALACRADEGLVGPLLLRVTAGDSLLEPGRPLRLLGPRVSGAQVRIAGVRARVLVRSDSAIEITVPDTLFLPCLRDGVRFDVDVRRGRQRAVLSLPAAAMPFKLDLDPGEHAIATDAVARGCAVELADSGEYIAMPFTWDRAEPGAALDTVRAQVAVTPLYGRPGPPAVDPVRRRLLPRRFASGVLRPDPGPWAASPAFWSGPDSPAASLPDPASPAACRALPDLGDQVSLPTSRTRGGLFAGLEGDVRRPENWKVVGTSAHLVVLFDDRTLQRARRNPAAQRRLLAFLDDYERLVAPFFATELPHWENHVRIPVLMTDSSQSRAHGFAYPEADSSLSCLGRLTNGALIWLDASPLLINAPARQTQLLATAAHETAHLADFGLRLPASRPREWRGWTVEGYAEVIRFLWASQGQPDPLISNLEAPPAIATSTGVPYRSSCGVGAARDKLQAMPATLDYPMACRMVSALLARAIAAGEPMPAVLERYSALPSRQTFTQIANALTGTIRPPNQVVGEWLLSWYADELPGTAAALQDPTWNLRRFYSPEALLDARVSTGGGVSSLALVDLDARYIDITTAGPTRIAYTSLTGVPLGSSRTDLAILRVR
ncbi:MAG: hypothetical protein AB7I33_05065 [Gemmatimonadales bacterium]